MLDSSVKSGFFSALFEITAFFWVRLTGTVKVRDRSQTSPQ